MKLPNQAKAVKRSSSAGTAAGVRPSFLGSIIGAGGNILCELACGNDRSCKNACGQAVQVGSTVGNLLTPLLI